MTTRNAHAAAISTAVSSALLTAAILLARGTELATAAAGDCVVTLPPNPLTATGLSTPWVVSGQGCTQTAAGMPTFAECAVVDPAANTVAIYSPLLINQGQKFVTPTVPTIPAGATVGCWFGTNGATTTLKDTTNGADLKNANCVNGANGNIFGQFAACNAANFFGAANGANIAVPALGTGKNGKPCYTTRSYQSVDMDPSDNMVTTYLVNANGMIGQKTVANAKTLTTELNNGSDNLLVDAFLRPALGCTAFTAKNLADPNGPPVGALALNELQAAKLQASPVALVPPNDPMVLINAAMSKKKLNRYRAAVNQPAGAGSAAEATTFCQNMLAVTAASIITDSQFTKVFTSPDPANGNNLFTFLVQRFEASWMGLGCMNLVQVQYLNGAKTTPIIANRNGNGVCVSMTANTAALQTLAVANGVNTKAA
ncbi:hypothetical protein DFJ73DRAFT_667044 [Zopfochytrium polystomum]|nr:hypothetical protein DFJ73DRAFT_667044 [Zopfochytrium polystomum]